MEDNTGQLLKKLREEKGISQNKLAELSGIDRAYISQLESGKRVTSISLKTARALAKGLNVSPEVFLSEDTMPQEPPQRAFEEILEEFKDKFQRLEIREIPILCHVPCGYPMPNEQSAGGFVVVIKDDLGYAKDKSDLFALIATGDSLAGDGIFPGDKLIVDPTPPSFQDGKIYAIRIGPEVTAKHVYKLDGKVKLVSSNSEYQEIIVDADQTEIIGRVILAGNWHKV